MAKETLEQQRDYYRRRWLVHGVRYSHHEYFMANRANEPSPEIVVLARAVEKDADALTR